MRAPFERRDRRSLYIASAGVPVPFAAVSPLASESAGYGHDRPLDMLKSARNNPVTLAPQARSMRNLLLAVAIIAAMTCLPVSAHHSYAAFETDRIVEISGVLEQFDVVAPHSLVKLRADEGRLVTGEWLAPVALRRRGVRPVAAEKRRPDRDRRKSTARFRGERHRQRQVGHAPRGWLDVGGSSSPGAALVLLVRFQGTGFEPVTDLPDRVDVRRAMRVRLDLGAQRRDAPVDTPRRDEHRIAPHGIQDDVA